MRKIEINEEQLEKLSLSELYNLRILKYDEFFKRIDTLILKHYPKAKSIDDVLELINCCVIEQKHRNDNALVSIMHVISDFQTQQGVSKSTYKFEEQIEDVSDLKKYVKITTSGPLFKRLRKNEMILRRPILFEQNQEIIYKAYNKEKRYVNQVSEIVSNTLTEQRLKTYGIPKHEMKGYSMDDIKLIFDICDTKFEKMLRPEIIKNIQSGIRKEEIIDTIITR